MCVATVARARSACGTSAGVLPLVNATGVHLPYYSLRHSCENVPIQKTHTTSPLRVQNKKRKKKKDTMSTTPSPMQAGASRSSIALFFFHGLHSAVCARPFTPISLHLFTPIRLHRFKRTYSFAPIHLAYFRVNTLIMGVIALFTPLHRLKHPCCLAPIHLPVSLWGEPSLATGVIAQEAVCYNRKRVLEGGA